MAIDERTRVTVEEGVVFATGGGRDLLCDIYRPNPAVLEAQAVTPALVLTHGGAWRGGNRQQLRRYGLRLAREGIVCVAHEYRLTPEARWPHHIEDTKAAIRWTRANAESLGIDADRIAIQGNSAGAHLALVAAGAPDVAELEGSGGNADVSSRVAACIAIYAPTVLRYRDGGPNTLAGITDQPSERTAAQASPITYARADFPPTLLIHGDADTTVPVRASIDMHAALRAAGATVELHIYANQPHAFDGKPEFGQRTSAEIAFFLDRYVRAAQPETAPPPRARASRAPATAAAASDAEASSATASS